MASSVEFGLHLIASCASSRKPNPFTVFPLPGSCFSPNVGSESLCLLHPLPKRNCSKFTFVRRCLTKTKASHDASHFSDKLSPEERGSQKYFVREDESFLAAPAGIRSAGNLDWLYSSPTYPSSVEKQPLSTGGANREIDGTMTASRDNFVSPRQIFRSIGTRSAPSRPSIPGKFSKYSKPGHPKRAFEEKSSSRKKGNSKVALLNKHEVSLSDESDSEIIWQPSETEDNSVPLPSASCLDDKQSSITFKTQFATRKGPVYTDPPPMPATDLPFQLQFSYSEAPKVDALGYREPPFSPFGPTSMPRPWTGRAPLIQKKKAKQLDSFNPPPPGKKGVKAVHLPGPYVNGEGPRPANTREEILGEPLSKEEVAKLVETCNKEQRQINLGRDGLVHNMLDLIHCHWKRRRVIKFKCKGVPTIDMDNVCFHVEDKTGGKIIHRVGGTFYLFRGRNYNTKDRPHIPLMLWKPAAPIYPKLIVPAPGGLTREEANAMRKRGRKVEPICRLAKNGVYINLVKDVRKAFEIDELVRVDCTGLNPSDYKKIGAKLKDLVPCVLLSFDNEHILMWRGNDCKSTEGGDAGAASDTIDHIESSNWLSYESSSVSPAFLDEAQVHSDVVLLEADLEEKVDIGNMENGASINLHWDKPKSVAEPQGYPSQMSVSINEVRMLELEKLKDGPEKHSNLFIKNASKALIDGANDVDALWEQAISSGQAIPLDESSLDPDTVFQKAAVLRDANCAGDQFTTEIDSDHDGKKSEDLDLTEQCSLPKKVSDNSMDLSGDNSSPIVAQPLGSLPIDELAKLLAS